MQEFPFTMTEVLAVLALFLMFITAIKYAIEDDFLRTRLMMTAFFLFIVFTLTVSFWSYALDTLPYTAPACLVGIFLGYIFGVRTEQQKLRTQGIEHYMEHFAHIHFRDVAQLSWWTVINFYSIMGGLILINLVGFTLVISNNSKPLAIASSVVGAFFIGTILPYLVHLWSVASDN